jgi:hypothetical protein
MMGTIEGAAGAAVRKLFLVAGILLVQGVTSDSRRGVVALSLPEVDAHSQTLRMDQSTKVVEVRTNCAAFPRGTAYAGPDLRVRQGAVAIPSFGGG